MGSPVLCHAAVVLFGEVGLGGELRPVPQSERRVSEAAKYGFSRVVMPRGRGRAGGRKRQVCADKTHAVCMADLPSMRTSLCRVHPPQEMTLEGPHGAHKVTVYRCRTLAEALHVALIRPLPPPRRMQKRSERGWEGDEDGEQGGLPEDWRP